MDAQLYAETREGEGTRIWWLGSVLANTLEGFQLTSNPIDTKVTTIDIKIAKEEWSYVTVPVAAKEAVHFLSYPADSEVTKTQSQRKGFFDDFEIRSTVFARNQVSTRFRRAVGGGIPRLLKTEKRGTFNVIMKIKTAATFVKSLQSANESTEAGQIPAFTPVLSGCSHLLHLLPPIRGIPAGTVLAKQGSSSNTIQLIERGLVKLVHVDASGRELTIGLRSQGWYAGSVSALLKVSSAYSVYAITSCRIVSISATEFFPRLAQNPQMMQHFLSMLCVEVASQTSLQVEVISSSAKDRLERFMRERLTSNPSLETLDPLPALKQMELAQLLGVTPEHLSRLMKKMQNASA